MQSRLKLGILGLVTAVVIAAAALTDRKGGTDPSQVASVAGTTQASTPGTGKGAPVTTAPSPIKPSADGKEYLFVSSNGVVMPVVGKSAAGYLARTPCGGEIQMSAGRLIGEATVVIDPGHGGFDTGTSTKGGLTEAALNLDVALRAKAALEKQGISVALTRESDYFLPIVRGVEIAAAAKAKVFLSIHHNGGAAAKLTGPGTEVYYQNASPDSKRLAGIMWEEVHFAFGTNYNISWFGASDAGAIYRLGSDGKSDYFGVLRRTAGAIPAVLIEAGYMSNPEEAALMTTDKYKDLEANAIAAAVKRYLTTADTGSGFKTPNARTNDSSGGTEAQCKEPKIATS